MVQHMVGKPIGHESGEAKTSPAELLVPLAQETLSYFEDSVAQAEAALLNSKVPSPDALASNNTFTSTAYQSLIAVSEDARRNLEAIIAQPAIARVEVTNERGELETIFITPGGAPRGRWGDVRVASYRSPIGRLAAIPVGQELEVRTPSGIKSYDLVGRVRLNPERRTNMWDSIDNVVEQLARVPLTVVSLRALLRAPIADDEALAILQGLLNRSAQDQNVYEGRRRAVLQRMGLREQPLLDQYQDEIFRLPLSSRVALLGPPGSGKTTTLIKRLGLKLDLQALDDDLSTIDRTLAGRKDHPTSWLMFSPTELLRQYAKEAFSRERVPASDHQVQVWDMYRRETCRNRLGVLRSATSRGAFLRDRLEKLLPTTVADQIHWFEDFDGWQKAAFWAELRDHAQRVAQETDSRLASLGLRLTRIVELGAARESAAPFVEFRALSREVGERATSLQAELDRSLQSSLARAVQADRELLSKFVAFLATLGDTVEPSDDPDDTDGEDEEEDVAPVARAAIDEAYQAYMRALRAHARALAVGRRLGPRTRHARIVDWFGARTPSEAELRQIGVSVLLATSLRRLANPMRAYLNGIPAKYRRFRRVRTVEDRWYGGAPIGAADLSPLELDLVMLAMLRIGGMLLREPQIASVVDEASITTLQAVRDLYKTQILVDEATDFSPLQLGCMAALCDPAAESFLACGDYNQRITRWGARSDADLKWVFPDMDIRNIRVTYRHSRQLNELAHRIAGLSEGGHHAATLPEHFDNEGVEPVLGVGLSEQKLVGWLKERIVEIERRTRVLPSIAVLVNREEEVEPLAEALRASLSELHIQCVGCPNGLVRGNDNDVRVFDVQHIKGLEFEAVFFVGIDDLARNQPDLFDKFLYVGATRAAMYLGLTSTSSLPARLAPIVDSFGSDWRRNTA